MKKQAEEVQVRRPGQALMELQGRPVFPHCPSQRLLSAYSVFYVAALEIGISTVACAQDVLYEYLLVY